MTSDRPGDLLLLQELPGVGPITLRALVERFGDARAALVARFDDFAAVAGAEAARARTDAGLRSRVDQALERAQRSATEVRTWHHPRYPPSLRPLADPPPVIFLHGRADLLERHPRVAVVGARRATARGRDVADRLGSALARRGVTVISGLALGVDGAAHQGALRAGGDTMAVLGTGTDVAYPSAHRRLHQAIAGRGLLVSEFVPGTRAAPHHFPRRNRVLAALADAVVVVEAGARSGALITVDHALDLGREVWAVPGPIDAATCSGSNRLLGEGARALVAIPEFVDEVAGPSRGLDRTRGGAPASSSPHEARVLDALGDGPLLADDLAVRLALPIGTTLALLTTLELHGEVERLPGMRYRRAA